MYVPLNLGNLDLLQYCRIRRRQVCGYFNRTTRPHVELEHVSFTSGIKEELQFLKGTAEVVIQTAAHSSVQVKTSLRSV